MVASEEAGGLTELAANMTARQNQSRSESDENGPTDYEECLACQ